MSVAIVSSLPKAVQTKTAGNPAESSETSAPDPDSATASVDFASLLQGQLAPQIPVPQPEINVKSDLPTSDAAPAENTALLAALGIVPLEPGRNTDNALAKVAPLADSGKLESRTSGALTAKHAGKLESRTSGALTAEHAGKLESRTSGALTIEHAGKLESRTSGALTIEHAGKLERSMWGALTTQQTAANAGQQLKTESEAESVALESTLTGILAADERPAKFAVASAVAPIVDAGASSKVSADSSPINLSTLNNTLHGNSNNLTAIRETELSVPTPIRDQNWASDFGQKIVWLAGNDKHSAQLTLNPAQMGPIEISLSVDKGNATAAFVSANADVREAIESALPRLREMFASAGIELGQTNVSAESFKQQAGSEGDNRNASKWMTDNAILVGDSAGSLPARAWATQQGNGLVDIFA